MDGTVWCDDGRSSCRTIRRCSLGPRVHCGSRCLKVRCMHSHAYIFVVHRDSTRSTSVAVAPPIQAVVESGAAVRLVALMDTFDADLQLETAWAVTNICSGQTSVIRFMTDRVRAISI